MGCESFILEGKLSAAEAMKYILGIERCEQMVIVTFLWLWRLEKTESEKARGEN